MKTYRVFVTRHYIAVDWIDLKADSPAKAKRKAEKLIAKERPDARAEATDNHWHADEPVEVDHPGAFNSGTHKMREIDVDAYMCEA